MAFDTSKVHWWINRWSQGAESNRESEWYGERGIMPSERSADASTLTLTTAANKYIDLVLSYVGGFVVPANARVFVSMRLRGNVGGFTESLTPIVIMDATTVVGSAWTGISGTSAAATYTQAIAVGASPITVNSLFQIRLRQDSARSVQFFPFHDETFVGFDDGYSGVAQPAASIQIIEPGQGSHLSPVPITSGRPSFFFRAKEVYPHQTLHLTKYADTMSTAAHSASGATTQAAGDAETLTTGFPDEVYHWREMAVAADATRKADVLTNTYYLVEIKDGATVRASVDYETLLTVTRPSLVSLNGTSADPAYTTQIAPMVRWTNPNATADRWQVRVYETSDDSLLHDSTETVSAATEYTLPDDLPDWTNIYVVVTVALGTDWTIDSLPGYFIIDNTATACKITSHEGSSDAPEVITTRAPTIEWSFTKDQAGLNVSAVDLSDQTPAYESGWIASATKSHALPANTLDLGASYSVQVQVKDNIGNVYSSDKRAWLHVNESSIAAPALTAESDATTADGVTLDWSAPAVTDGDDLTYTLTLTTDDETTTHSNIVGTSHHVGRLSAGTYEWTVYATDEHGLDGATAAPDEFVISQAGSVPTVALVPWGPSTTTTPISTWVYADADGDAQDAYQIQTATDAGFTAGVVDSGTVVSTASYHQHGTLVAGTYHRRVKVRTNATDWSDWSTADTISIVAATTQTNDFDLLNDATPITQAVSGISVTRRLDGPTAFGFTIDNFDGLQGGIDDGDTITLRLKDSAGQRLEFVGEVVDRNVGLLCEIQCEDPAYKFERWAVSLDLVNASLGQVVAAIVENPTGSAATGITAQVDEIEDPSTPGTPIHFTRFKGGGRSVKAWLDEFKRTTGLRWFLHWDGGWIFRAFNPADAPTWAVTLKDSIDHEDESGSQARILDAPSIRSSRYPYINRVRYRALQAGPPLPPGITSYDEYLTQGTGWTAYAGVVAAADADAVMGTNSVKFTKTIAPSGTTAAVPERLDFGYFLLPAGWREWTPVFWGQILAKAKLTITRDATDEMTARLGAGRTYSPRMHWHWGSNVGPGLAEGRATVANSVYRWSDGGYLFSSGRLKASDTWYGLPFRVQQYDIWRGPDGTVPLTDVGAISLHVYQSRPLPAVVADGETWTATLYLDDMSIVGVPAADPQGYDLYVETAAVTAGTEVPIEDSLSSVYLTSEIAQTLARSRLALANRTYHTVGNLRLSGIRNIPLTSLIPVALTTVGESGSYPVAEVQWQPLDAGDTTTLVIGDFPLDVARGLQRTLQRVQAAESAPFAI